MSIPLEIAVPPARSLTKRAAKSAAWITLEMAGIQAISFVVFAAMAHFIEPRDFGLISISFLAIQSLQMLVLYNVTTVAVRKQEVSDLDFTTTFWIMLGIASVAFLALFGVSDYAERLFRAAGLAPVLRAMSVIILFMGLSRTHETWMMRHFQFKPLAIRGLAGAVAGGAVGLFLAIKGFGVNALVGQQIVTSVVSVTLLWVVCPWRPGYRFSTGTAAEIFAFMRRITPNSVVYAINQNCDTFLVALFFGPVSAGLYNVGKRVRLALQMVVGEPIKGIALPTLAEMQSDDEKLRRGVLKSLTMICVICAPAFFGASAVAHDAVHVIFGPKWGAAAPVMQLLSLGGLSVVLLAYNDNIFVLKNRPIWCLYVSLTYSLLAVVFVTYCWHLKIHAMALPFVLPYLIVFPLSAMLVSKCIALKPQQWVVAMLPGIGSATAMFIFVQILAHYLQGYGSLARLLILCVAGAVSYMAVFCVFWRETAGSVVDVLRPLRHR
jgi:O-antigen/teichoic acid export membrane protein